VIQNACNTPLNARAGSVPDVSGAITDYFQEMVFSRISKSVVNFQAIETPTQVTGQGMIQPLRQRDLQLMPEGQRAWSWVRIFTDTSLEFGVDEVVSYLGKQYRIMSALDYSLYGFFEYGAIEDWTGAGP
jgi:hypothetical protein